MDNLGYPHLPSVAISGLFLPESKLTNGTGAARQQKCARILVASMHGPIAPLRSYFPIADPPLDNKHHSDQGTTKPLYVSGVALDKDGHSGTFLTSSIPRLLLAIAAPSFDAVFIYPWRQDHYRQSNFFTEIFLSTTVQEFRHFSVFENHSYAKPAYFELTPLSLLRQFHGCFSVVVFRVALAPCLLIEKWPLHALLHNRTKSSREEPDLSIF